MTTEQRDFNAAAFYEFLKEGKLMGTRCGACGKLSVEPRPMCPACHSREVAWYQFSGKGQLSTFTCISIVPVAMAEKGYGRNNPYCSGVVTLEEGPRISARVLGVDASHPQSIQTGMLVELTTEDLDQDKPAVAFQPV